MWEGGGRQWVIGWPPSTFIHINEGLTCIIFARRICHTIHLPSHDYTSHDNAKIPIWQFTRKAIYDPEISIVEIDILLKGKQNIEGKIHVNMKYNENNILSRTHAASFYSIWFHTFFCDTNVYLNSQSAKYLNMATLCTKSNKTVNVNLLLTVAVINFSSPTIKED